MERGPATVASGGRGADRKRPYKWCANSSPSEQLTLHPGTPKEITEALRKCSWLLSGRMGLGGDDVRASWSQCTKDREHPG